MRLRGASVRTVIQASANAINKESSVEPPTKAAVDPSTDQKSSRRLQSVTKLSTDHRARRDAEGQERTTERSDHLHDQGDREKDRDH